MNKIKLTLNCERSETVKHKMAEELEFLTLLLSCVGWLFMVTFFLTDI